jgi:hypothetical protein
LPPLPGPETATPERPTVIRPGVVRIDRIGLELSTEGKFMFDIRDDDPLSAVAEMRRTETIARGPWQVRIETQMRLSCTRDMFLLRATLRAWEGTGEVCHREWDDCIPRDFL